MSKNIIVNFVLFQLGWFACVLGGAHRQPALGSAIVIAIVLYHLYQANVVRLEIKLLLIAVVIGIVFESTMTFLGLARYSVGQVHPEIAPYWMILMWPLFATTLNLSMRWLKRLHLILVAIIGGLLAPLAYYSGNMLGAVVYDELVVSLSVIGFSWALLFPILVVSAKKFNGFDEPRISGRTVV